MGQTIKFSFFWEIVQKRLERSLLQQQAEGNA